MPEALLNICKFLPSEPERDVLLPLLLRVSDLPGDLRLVLFYRTSWFLKLGEAGMVFGSRSLCRNNVWLWNRGEGVGGLELE